MCSSSIPVIVAVLAITNLSACGAQDSDQTRVYEALFAQVDRLGLDRTYYVGETEGRPNLFSVPAGFHIPEELTNHRVEDFGNVPVVLVEEDFLAGLWDSSCRDGWARFHERYPEAGDLTQVSKIAFDDNRDQAAVYVTLGRGCLYAWFATYYLQKQDGEWVISGGANFGEA